MIRKGIFYDLGIPTSEGRAEELERKIKTIVGMDGHNCHEVWTKVNQWLEDPKLRESLRKKLTE